MWGASPLGDQSSNIARFRCAGGRLAAVGSGVTINRACGSGQQAIESAAPDRRCVRHRCRRWCGDDVAGATGATRASGFPYGQTVLDRYGVDKLDQGIGAEMIASQWGLSRYALDEYASRSHGWRPQPSTVVHLSRRSCLSTPRTARSPSTRACGAAPLPEKLSGLKPSFRGDGVIHAGNASQISDGASAVMIMTSQKAAEFGLTPIVRLVAGTVVGDDPVKMLTGPIPATQKLLARTGLSIDDIGGWKSTRRSHPCRWPGGSTSVPDSIGSTRWAGRSRLLPSAWRNRRFSPPN